MAVIQLFGMRLRVPLTIQKYIALYGGRKKVLMDTNSANKAIIVGRPINGISINGLEYVLHDDGRTMEFANEKAAKDYLLQKGVDPKAFESLIFEEVESDEEPSEYDRFKFESLRSHIGHDIVVVSYGDDYNVAIECEDCNVVLYSLDNPDIKWVAPDEE